MVGFAAPSLTNSNRRRDSRGNSSLAAPVCDWDGVFVGRGLYAARVSNPASPTFNSLYTVDLATGKATRVGSFGAGSMKSDFIMSFSFDPEGDMYGASMMSIYEIDRSTGAATKVVDIVGATRVMGIAFVREANFMPLTTLAYRRAQRSTASIWRLAWWPKVASTLSGPAGVPRRKQHLGNTSDARWARQR